MPETSSAKTVRRVGHTRFGSFFALILSFLAPVVALGNTDLAGPELTSITISPLEIDVSSGSATLSIEVTATDDSAIDWARSHVYFKTPVNTNLVVRNFSSSSPHVATAELSASNYEGTYRINNVNLYDEHGTESNFFTTRLIELGAAESFELTGGRTDFAGPELTSITISPLEIDVSSGSATLSIEVTATDDSAIDWARSHVYFKTPVNTNLVVRNFSSSSPHVATAELSASNYEGTYRINNVNLYDEHGTESNFFTTRLIELGAAESFELTGGRTDFAGPELTSITISPLEIDVSSGSATLSIEVTATDDSAIDWARSHVYFKTPVNTNLVVRNFSSSSPHVATAELSASNYEGTYRINNVNLYDEHGTESNFFTTRLIELGAAESFTVFQIDTDGDGLGNYDDLDDDGDGVPDDLDRFPLDPLESVDTDHDGIGNYADLDDDNDGVEDYRDGFPLIALGGRTDTDSDGRPDDCNSECQALGMSADFDDDGDGMSDALELANGLNPLDGVDCPKWYCGGVPKVITLVTSSTFDFDGDGLTRAQEESAGTNWRLADSDGDGLLDGDEVSRSSDPLRSDSDGDGLSDSQEVELGTSPVLGDTDGDSMSDSEEIAEGLSPTDGSDCPRWHCGGLNLPAILGIGTN